MVPLRDIKGEEIDRNSLFEYLHYTTIIVTWVMLGVRKLHIQMESIRKTTKQKRKQSFKAKKKEKKKRNLLERFQTSNWKIVETCLIMIKKT